MTDDTEDRHRVEQEPDFVAIRRFGNSLERVEEKYPEVTPDKVIAAALCIPEEQLEAEKARVTEELRRLMGIATEGK